MNPTFLCFRNELWSNTGYKKTHTQTYEQKERALKRINEEVDSLAFTHREIIIPLNSYFLCKQDLPTSESVMNMVRLSLTNDSTLKEFGRSIDKIKAAAEISTEQSEELVNT